MHCGGRYPYGTPAARNFQHIGGTLWKSHGRIWQMFCRKSTEQGKRPVLAMWDRYCGRGAPYP